MINISKLYCGLDSESDYLRYERGKALGPVAVYNCTSRCNLRCLHCYSSSPADSSNKELTTDQAKLLLSQLAEYNCPVVLFSGGEPLLREDIFELTAKTVQLGMRAVISTNGTLIDAKTAQKLADAAVSYVGISIDGTKEFHDRFRGVDGSFDAALAGMTNSKKVSIKTGLRFTITKDNADQIAAVFDIAAETATCRICFYHLIRTGRARQLDEQILDSGQTRHVVDSIIERTAEFVKKDMVDEVLTVGNHADGVYVLIKMLQQVKDNAEQAHRLLLANGGNKIGENIVCIGPDGSIYPDQFWRNYRLGNIKDSSFRQIWNNKQEPVLHMLRNKSQFADKRCLRCKWFDLCKGNFRFLAADPDIKHWLNEPACYLTDEEIAVPTKSGVS